MSAQDWSRVVHKGRRKTKANANSISVKAKPGPKRKPIPHGTVSGHSAHYYHKELPPCEPCKQAASDRARQWREKNPDYSKRKWKEWKSKNPNYKKNYHKENPEQTRQDARRRRARKRNVESEIFTEQQVLDLYGTNCHLCSEPIDIDAPRLQGRGEGWEMGLHLDHLVPISRGGSNTLENVRPSHVICNLRKGVRWKNTAE